MCKKKQLGYIEMPVQSCIDFDHIIIDLLHCFLRISDKLFEIFLEKLNDILFDGEITDVDIEKRKNLKVFNDFLTQVCQISKPIYLSKNNEIKMRSLNGFDRKKIFSIFSSEILVFRPEIPENKANKEPKKLPLLKKIKRYTHSRLKYPAVEDEYEKFKDVQNETEKLKKMILSQYMSNTDKVWLKFWELYQEANKPLNEIDLSQFKKDLINWGEMYKPLEKTGKYTPYIHSFITHVPEMILKYKDINKYKCENIEKLNEFVKRDYKQNTNKLSKKYYQDTPYLLQLLKKTNRDNLHDIPYII